MLKRKLLLAVAALAMLGIQTQAVHALDVSVNRGTMTVKGGGGNDTIRVWDRSMSRWTTFRQGISVRFGLVRWTEYYVSLDGKVVKTIKSNFVPPSGMSDSEVRGMLGTDAKLRYIRIHAGAGDDDVTNSTDLPSSIYGEEGDDFLQGGTNQDYIDGGPGSDDLWGKEDYDVLISGPANDPYQFDFLHGGLDEDAFIYHAYDTISLGGYLSGGVWVLSPNRYGWQINHNRIYSSGRYKGMRFFME